MEPTCGSFGTLELKMEGSEMGESARLSLLLPSRSVIAQPVETIVMEMKILRKTLAMGLVAITVFSATAQADEGQESSVVTVGKSTFYGALTGLLVGSATALVAGGNSGDILKWSFVGGTAVGLVWGIHDVSTRPEQNTAMFSLKSDGSTTVSLPTPQLRYSGNGDLGFDMTVFSLAF
jgi:hypothetical protein